MDYKTESIPLLTHSEPEPDVENTSKNNSVNSSDLCIVDGQTSILSITSVGTDGITTLASHFKHPCYAVLNSGRRTQLKTMPYRINLIDSILALAPSSFLPSMLSTAQNVKQWYYKYTIYMKMPRNWKRAIMAHAICELT